MRLTYELCHTTIEKTYLHEISRQYIFGKIVCQKALFGTLQISNTRMNKALCKQQCDKYEDGRGRTTGGFNAFPPSTTAAHIASFPRYISHYTRAVTESKFLSSDLNLSKMYQLFQEETDRPVSESFYRRIFYKHFNLRVKKPKKDTCHLYDVTNRTCAGAKL